MDAPEKIAHYLTEARASERALTRVLQSQIAMTPPGSYRSRLKNHLGETRDHAQRIGVRLADLEVRGRTLLGAIGVAETLVGQMLALGKTPLDLVRGASGAEKVLKNAKDAAATEQLEIATYTAIERLAETAGDDITAKLARSIRAEEEAMLADIMIEIPRLTDAVAASELHDDPSYHPSVTKGAIADEKDLPIARYDSLTVNDIARRLPSLSQVDLAQVAAYERAHKDRAGVLRAARREPARAR